MEPHKGRLKMYRSMKFVSGMDICLHTSDASVNFHSTKIKNFALSFFKLCIFSNALNSASLYI